VGWYERKATNLKKEGIFLRTGKKAGKFKNQKP